ncbi:MAG: ROK family transcriptional regulator, partial [Bryobacteraceae bacterium]
MMPTVSFTTNGALRKSALREANERLVLDAIRRRPGIARCEIARITGFSRTSVTFVVNRLLSNSLVREEKLENAAQAGRPPTALHLCA